MSTLAEIESAIERLAPAERAELARWWQETFDPDEGLELQQSIADELHVAQREIERGAVAIWQDIKDSARTTAG